MEVIQPRLRFWCLDQFGEFLNSNIYSEKQRGVVQNAFGLVILFFLSV